MSEPGIKGTLFEAVVEDLERVIEEGRLTREELEARAEPADLALLEEKINPARWYDLFAYHRLVDILTDVEGGGRKSYWFTRGERAAKRMEALGIYQQMEYLGRTATSRATDQEARFKAFAKDLKLLLTLQATLLNVGEWKCVVDPDQPDRYRVEISGIDGIPDGVFMAAAGVFSALSRMAGRQTTLAWFYERVSPDLALIRMRGPV